MDFSLSGLASGFDWKTFVNQMMAVQNAPIDRLKNEKTVNINKNAALNDLKTKLTALQTSSAALGAAGLFSGRKAVSTTANSTWTSLAATSTATGSYKIAVSQLATAAQRNGTTDVGNGFNTINDDVSALTVATLPTAIAVTAGTFSVNGKQVTVALTDSLDQVFAAISTATSGAVTAGYDHLTDTITLSGGSEVVLGAANDTSNFLTALRLTNNGTATVESSGKLGALDSAATLANARLKATITAVDGTGAGSFSVNGVTISYNLNTDSLNTVLGRINDSSAGVVASYDAVTDRVVLRNGATGDTGIGVSEAAGGLMDALGLSSGSALVRGKNANFTLNDGATLISASNTLAAADHGITGLSVTVDSVATQTVSVAGDTASMRSAIESFISKFNEVQTYIDDQSKTSTSVAGKVTISVLTNDREVQSWNDSLRSMAFGAVSGLSGTISRLENMGIDFTTGTSQLAIKDTIKLEAALRDKAGDVEDFFQTASTGLTDQIETFLTKINTQNTAQQAQITKSNTGIDEQIAAIQRRLDQQRAALTASFIAMETAQSALQSQASALTKAFASPSSG